MIYEGLLFGLGFVLGWILLYGLSWVVLGAVWLVIGDDSPVVRSMRSWRDRWRRRKYRAVVHLVDPNVPGMCARCGASFLGLRPWHLSRDVYELRKGHEGPFFVLGVDDGVPCQPCAVSQ